MRYVTRQAMPPRKDWISSAISKQVTWIASGDQTTDQPRVFPRNETIPVTSDLEN